MKTLGIINYTILTKSGMPVFVLYNEFKVMYDASNIQFKGFECFWLGGPDVIYSE